MSCIDHNTVRWLTDGRTKIIIVHGRCCLSNGESRLPQIQPKTDTNKTENQNHCAAKGKAIARFFLLRCTECFAMMTSPAVL